MLRKYPEFIERVDGVSSVDEADVEIRAGAEIIEKLADDGRANDRARLDSPPSEAAS